MNRFNRGALTPLLFAWRWLIFGSVLLVSACSRHTASTSFSASGYITDQGIVRIWRKEGDDGTVHILKVFTDSQSKTVIKSEYRWNDNQLISAELTTQGEHPEQIKMRFDNQGELNFMQREAGGQKQPLSTEQIALYKNQAAETKATSDAKRSDNVMLLQGRWQGTGNVTTCSGQQIQLALGSEAIIEINKRQSHLSTPASIAWLQTPDGAKLLLVTDDDICSWQPKPDDF